MFETIKELVRFGRQKLAQVINPEPPKPIELYVIFSRLLSTYPVISVLLDPSVEGVILPLNLMADKEVALRYGLNLLNPIPDLKVGEDGISATLSFGGSPFKTFVPWKSVRGMGPGGLPPVGPGSGSPQLIGLKGGKYIEASNDQAKVKMAA